MNIDKDVKIKGKVYIEANSIKFGKNVSIYSGVHI